MALIMSIIATVVLVIFYLAALFRPKMICRKGCYLVGVAALLLALLLVGFFSTFIGKTRSDNPNWAAILCSILSAILNATAFGAGVTACYPGNVPMAGMIDEASSEIAGEGQAANPPAPQQGQGSA